MTLAIVEPLKVAKYSPIDPLFLGVVSACPNKGGLGVVSGVVGNNADLFETVASLWIGPEDVVVDATFGRGVFWKKLPGLPTHRYDLMHGDDLRDLPHRDSSVDVLVLDPPYRPTHGSKTFGGNGLAAAYQLGTAKLDTINDILDLYREGMREAYRVLKPGGRLMVKCQDLSYGHKLHLVSADVLRDAQQIGFGLADQFILLNEARLTSSKWVSQERARRSHSVLWVVVKPKQRGRH